MQELITINIWLAGRSYRIRVRPEEEASVRAAVKAADEKITELRQHYAGKDDQDFVAMCLLIYATDSVSGNTGHLEKDLIGDLIRRIDTMLGDDI